MRRALGSASIRFTCPSRISRPDQAAVRGGGEQLFVGNADPQERREQRRQLVPVQVAGLIHHPGDLLVHPEQELRRLQQCPQRPARGLRECQLFAERSVVDHEHRVRFALIQWPPKQPPPHGAHEGGATVRCRLGAGSEASGERRHVGPLGHAVGDLEVGERVLFDAGLLVCEVLQHAIPGVVGDAARRRVELGGQQGHAQHVSDAVLIFELADARGEPHAAEHGRLTGCSSAAAAGRPRRAGARRAETRRAGTRLEPPPRRCRRPKESRKNDCRSWQPFGSCPR